ncbi:unnamed protein product [Acanthoscelides obtectus]|uniref:Uncharacterized protein n=1 Tax=Acanthoscelides obtectus TaxID=200917 RepID=A0A9P0PEN1_ACAOB|nr:unnamed protein product [Acanthoscelides obtectus]CAK1671909.1 hypothetical protein AOBTE_LOCUS28529 [Acanthoscelides obtectus]
MRKIAPRCHDNNWAFELSELNFAKDDTALRTYKRWIPQIRTNLSPTLKMGAAILKIGTTIATIAIAGK